MDDCTDACYEMPKCATCQRTKKPIGRDAAAGTYYCDSDCEGYRQAPYPGHMWPSEKGCDPHD